jgi:hypothetical protein
MNRPTAVFLASLFATTAGAADVYQDFARGNRDLRTEPNDFTASGVIQYGVGDSVDRYQGWADGNPDFLKRFDAPVTHHEPPNIYQGARGNPDL